MKVPCTGVILSGGKNKRFDGKNKAFIQIDSITIINRIFNIFTNIFNDIIIVTNDPASYVDFDCCIVTDHYNIRSSLNGIYSGLFASKENYSFFIACDAPFADQKLIKFILDEIEINKDIIIPKTRLGFEPMFAVYSKQCLKSIKRQIEKGDFQIKKLFDKVRVKKLDEIYLKREDPKLGSFFNINTPEDLIKAKKLFEDSKSFS